MVQPELKAGPRALVDHYGDLRRRMHEAVEEAFDFVEALVSGPKGIACDYERTGRLELAFGSSSSAVLRRLADELVDAGSVAKYVEADELAAERGLHTWLGHRMAGAICGDELPPFAELEHQPVPLHRWRRAWLPAASLGFRAQDWLGARGRAVVG